LKKLFAALALVLLSAPPAFADLQRRQTFTAGEEQPLPEQKWISYTREEGIKVEPPGLHIKPSATFIVQGSTDSNKGGDEKLGLSYVLYVPIEKRFSDWGRAFIELKSGCGNTIINDLSLFDNVNFNAYDIKGQWRLRKYWLEGNFFDNQFSGFIGKEDATKRVFQNKYALDDDTQFLNTMFDTASTMEYPPDYTYMIHSLAKLKKMEFLEWEFNYFKGDATSRNIFDHGIFTNQLNLKPELLFGLDPAQWAGNYRLCGWVNTQNHIKLLDDTSQKNWNYGIGMSIDQMLTDTFAVFGRFGWQRPDLIPLTGNNGATIDWSWFSGMQVSGKFWGRKNDVVSFAVGQLFPSDDYAKAGFPASAEGHFETYYNWHINDFVQISPDIQVIWNPNGVGNSSEGDDHTLFVYALRGHICF